MLESGGGIVSVAERTLVNRKLFRTGSYLGDAERHLFFTPYGWGEAYESQKNTGLERSYNIY